MEGGAEASHAGSMTETTAISAPVLPATLRLGAVHLTVTDLDRSIGFYQDAIGLKLHQRDGDAAALGAGGEDLIVLHEAPFAKAAGRHAGLYHVALLHPSREELARALVRLANTRTYIEGASDHGISEAIYLPDPDGNGIELAADRPTSATSSAASPSTATCSASRSRRCSRAPPSSPPAATTTTWASTSGAARACRPRQPARSACANGP
jgi:catechol 2,3-dioxygenase-like lactoylglutathione lyase family enzyme